MAIGYRYNIRFLDIIAWGYYLERSFTLKVVKYSIMQRIL